MDHRNPHHRQKFLSRIYKHHKRRPENYDNSICKHSATVDTFFFAAPLYKQRSPINIYGSIIELRSPRPLVVLIYNSLVFNFSTYELT